MRAAAEHAIVAQTGRGWYMVVIDAAHFRATLFEELRAAWHVLRAAHPSERFYSFGVYTAELAEYLTVTASTEEGLSQVTAEYLIKYGGDATVRRAALRWSPCDSPLHREGESLLPLSSAIRATGPDPYDDSPESVACVSLVFSTAVDVLRALDEEGLFGSGLERHRLVLGVWKGDQSDEELLEFARGLNPPSVVKRFASELDEAAKAFVALTASSTSSRHK